MDTALAANPPEAAGSAGTAPQLESFSYDDAVVRKFLFAMVAWALVAFLVGIILAIQLPFPVIPGTDIPTNLGLEYLTFGRIRPLHTNAAIFAFAGNAIFAGIYYSTQRLCKTRMFSDTLSNLNFWGWQLIILLAAITLPMGVTQSKEYAELEWPIDILIAVVWLGFFGVNFFMTLMRRRERHMYVALWFYIATIVTVTVLHVFNNLVVPTGILKSYPIYAGVQDAFMQWWYGHNAVAFFLTTPFLGMMYYFLPKQAERPVFSYRLSIVHFWSLVFIYIWAGPHHLQYTALPDWAASLGMLFSLMLWMPSWGGMVNFLLTLRGAWHKVASDPILKFFVVATTFYGMATFEGPMLSIKSVNALSHYTDWTIAHVHSGALGWNGFLAFGMAYFLAPRLFQAKLFSRKLANLHFWLATFGILLYIIPIYVAGITQGLMWRAMTDTGVLAYQGPTGFIQTVEAIIPMYVLRILGGLAYMAGACIGAYNLYRTWAARPAKYDVPVYQAAPLSKHYDGDPQRPAPTISGVTNFALRLNVWSTGWWHRRWERLPMRFTAWVVIAVVVASLFEIIPTFVIRSNVPTIETVEPYTPLELAGRDIYIAEGCYNCHSQMIRPILAEVERYGEYSKPGEFVYDHPFQWGSRRIGPDLARVGQSNPQALWHVLHFDNPGEHVPGSIMPPYKWLLEQELDTESIPVRVRAIMALHPGDKHWDKFSFNDGKPYPTGDEAVEHAKTQAAKIHAELEEQNDNGPYVLTWKEKVDEDGEVVKDKNGKVVMVPDKVVEPGSKVIALIAYLQRLGTDLNRTPAADDESGEPAEATAESDNKTATTTLGSVGVKGGR